MQRFSRFVKECNTCIGCYPVFHVNQLLHMEQGGCLYIDNVELNNVSEDKNEDWITDDIEDDEDEEPQVTVNLAATFEEVAVTTPEEKKDLSEAIVAPLFALPCGFTFPECAICFDTIDMVNVTITTCGHSFHSSCVFKALEMNENCPMCRHQLVEVIDDDEEGDDEENSDDESSGSEDNDDDHSINTDDEDAKVTLEQLATKVTNMGYTINDLLKFFVYDIKSSNQARYSDDFMEKISDDLNGVIDGTIPLSSRDKRSYATVVKTSVIPEQENSI